MKLLNFGISVLVLQLSIFNSFAQESSEIYEQKQTFISIGVSKPFLINGNELLSSENIREQELSYFENENGEIKTVGAYSGLIGWNLCIGFYNPIENAYRLMWGAEVNLNLTGSTPADGYQEAYYFNYVSFNFGLKYYPVSDVNLFIKTNAGFASVMTKNRFINDLNEQNFLHQFGLGINGAGVIGYSFPTKTKFLSAIEISAEYKLSNVRVEVNVIGNDKWTYSSLDFKLGFLF
jgi:hypothetical protein